MNPIKPFDWFLGGSIVLVGGATLIDGSPLFYTGTTVMAIGAVSIFVAFVIAMKNNA